MRGNYILFFYKECRSETLSTYCGKLIKRSQLIVLISNRSDFRCYKIILRDTSTELFM